MRKLTYLAAIVALAGPAHAGEDRTVAVAAAVKGDVVLATQASGGTADAAAAAVRRVAQAKLGQLTDDEVVVALIALSDRMSQDDRSADALRLGEHAVALTRKGALGPSLMFDALSRTGGARYHRDDYDGAARDLDGARQAAAAIVPFDANSVANATANYAVILDQAGRYREAETALRESIVLRGRATEQRPANTAIAWMALAAVHKRMGRHDLSEQDYRTGLDLLENAGQGSTRGYAMSLHNYGVLMAELGRDEDAAALYRRAIELVPADKRHAPSMINDYTSLAASLMALGRLDAAAMAVADAERAAASGGKDSDQVNALSARAQLTARQGDPVGAVRYSAKALALGRSTLRPGQIDLLELMTEHADLLMRTGQIDDARRLIAETIEQGADIPDRNPLKAIAQATQAMALEAGNDRAGALTAARRATETQARRFAEESGRTPIPLQREERDIAAQRIALLWIAAGH